MVKITAPIYTNELCEWLVGTMSSRTFAQNFEFCLEPFISEKTHIFVAMVGIYSFIYFCISIQIQAFLPVMGGFDSKSAGLRMSTHYADPPMFETTRKLSTSRSYNDKARQALPGLGGGAAETSCKIGKC